MRDVARSLTALSLTLLVAAWLAVPASAQYRGEDVVYPGRGEFEPPPPPPIQESDFTCAYSAEYRIVWGDGRSGRLVLHAPTQPFDIPTGFIEAGSTTFPLVHHSLTDPQDVIDGEQGPGYLGTDSALGHRIVFWVDFNSTSSTIRDDQRFDGYLMTVTRNAIAGVTWAGGVPYGFYATDKQCIDIEG